MTPQFCSQCGKQIPAENSFCPVCGASQRVNVQEPPRTYQSPYQSAAPSNPPPYQAATPSYPPPYNPATQAYQQPYQAGPQPSYGAPRVTTVKATGLIIGVFALAVVFILAVLTFILPSKEDFSLLSLEEGPQSSISTGPEQTSVDDEHDSDESGSNESSSGAPFGEPPAAVLDQINVRAVPEDYAGSYSGTVSFRSENLDMMTELTGDSSFADITANYDGNSYKCTAEVDDCVRAFSSEIYSENDDGSFYTYYYFDIDLEDGFAVYEESDTDDEMGLQYYIADKAYFLTDGSIYVISIVTAENKDGESLTSEMRFELSPIR